MANRSIAALALVLALGLPAAAQATESANTRTGVEAATDAVQRIQMRNRTEMLRKVTGAAVEQARRAQAMEPGGNRDSERGSAASQN